jgi:hypothetical protein
MKSKSRTDTVKIISGVTGGIMLIVFILFSFRVIDTATFWVLTAIIAAFTFFGLPKIRKYFAE